MLKQSRSWRAAVIEPHVMQRNRVAELLDADAGMEVVHTGESLRELLLWLRHHGRSQWPHLLVLDLADPQTLDADLAALSALRTAGMRVLLLSSLASSRLGLRLVGVEVDAIVSKRDSEADFHMAVRSLRDGRSLVTARAAAALADRPPKPQLSTQELRVFEIYASGMTIAHAAEVLGVRQDTARKYLGRVKRKYTEIGRKARTKLDLARLAWEDGYSVTPIPPTDGSLA